MDGCKGPFWERNVVTAGSLLDRPEVVSWGRDGDGNSSVVGVTWEVESIPVADGVVQDVLGSDSEAVVSVVSGLRDINVQLSFGRVLPGERNLIGRPVLVVRAARRIWKGWISIGKVMLLVVAPIIHQEVVGLSIRVERILVGRHIKLVRIN